MNIFRVVLQVGDLERASDFYAALLGIDGREVGGGRVYFHLGEVVLSILDPTSGGLEPAPNVEDLYLTVEDIDAVYKRASLLGCLSTEHIHDQPAGDIVTRPWGERSFYVADPWNNSLCFVDPTTVFSGL